MSATDLSQRFSEQADEILDEVLPDSFDWQRMVRDYPLPAMTVAAAGGLWLGSRHGSTVVSAVLTFGAAEASRIAGDLLAQVLGNNPLAREPFDVEPHDVEQ